MGKLDTVGGRSRSRTGIGASIVLVYSVVALLFIDEYVVRAKQLSSDTNLIATLWILVAVNAGSMLLIAGLFLRASSRRVLVSFLVSGFCFNVAAFVLTVGFPVY